MSNNQNPQTLQILQRDIASNVWAGTALRDADVITLYVLRKSESRYTYATENMHLFQALHPF